MSVASILGACVNQFQSDTVITALVPGGLWLDEVPEDTSLLQQGPFGVLIHLGQVPEPTFELPETDTDTVQFIFFAVGAAAAEAIATQMKTTFNKEVQLNLTGTNFVSMRRTRFQLGAEEIRTANNEKVWHALLEYEIWTVAQVT